MTKHIELKDKSKNKNSSVKNIHDKFFKLVFSEPEVSIDLFKHHLPPDVFNKIDLDTLKLSNKSFISEEYADKYSDLVYSAKINGSSSYLYILAEHQSTNDKYMSARLLEYNASIMKEHMKKFKTKKAPIIINILIYAGKNEYTGPKTYYEMFENPELAKEIMFKDLHLVNLQATGINELSKDGKAAAAEILLKQGIKRDIGKFLEENVKILKVLMYELPYLNKATDYIFFLNSGKNQEKIVNLLKEVTQNEELVMNLAQHFRNEGILKGMQKGIQEEKTIVAKNLLKMNLDKSIIQKATGLSKKQLDDLNKK